MSNGADMAADDPEGDIARRREAIDAIDREILRLVNDRAREAKAIGELKGGTPTYRAEREAQILRRVRESNPGPLSADAAAAVFREIVSGCRAAEQSLRIAYLGPAGTFSHAAVSRHFGQSVSTEPCAGIDEVFRSVEAGQADFAVVPVENSTEGTVGRTLDLMVNTPLLICGEVKLRVRQHLMARLDALGEVRKVYSHAQSLGQCTQWLNAHLRTVPRVPVASNAEAARLASVEPGAAAIAGENAAAVYQLALLARDIEDDPNNTTRFWVLGGQHTPSSGSDQTSLVMSAPNRPGAVHRLLEPFARHGVSMTRLESRPAHTGLWEYLFYVDLDGHADDPSVSAALAELSERAPFLKILGAYPKAPVT